ncbi:MAG: HDOD domain-containing protein, partial [Candidatus Eisenbacteria bacterium]|nr:HDOD domain-containing protein [Candidatus Eisenbacteria bacterium]
MSKESNIIFVDDEPRVLDGIRRMLRPKRNDWKMVFVTGGPEALDLMGQTPFDVIVSDMRMPGMNGVELLNHVRRQFPQTIRIAFSGQASKEMALRCAGPVHQFIPKPTDAKMLIDTIEGACSLHSHLSITSLKVGISQLESLPSLPRPYRALFDQTITPSTPLDQIANVIANDLGLSSKILQLANSAFFSTDARVSKISDAVHQIGFEAIKDLVHTVGILRPIQDDSPVIPHLEEIWHHSLTVADLARRIAAYENAASNVQDDAYLAGMLHNIGALVLATLFPDSYTFGQVSKILDISSGGIAEQVPLETPYAEVGTYLLGLWGFADSILDATAYHHNPSASSTCEFGPLAAVHVARAILLEESGKLQIGLDSHIDHEFVEKIGKID